MSERKESFFKMLSGLVPFWKVQDGDWKATVVRTSLQKLGYQIIYPYLSLYIIALGATKTQLGTINSVGLLVMGLLGPWVGSFIDKNGAKPAYLTGIFLTFMSYMLYAFAKDWRLCIAAMIVYYFGNGVAGQSCSTICGSCLKNCDRARGMLICESLAAGFLGMLGPVIAAFLLVRIIGVEESNATAGDYRYLFYASALFTLISFVFICVKLSARKMNTNRGKGFAIFRESADVIRSNKSAVKGIVIGIVCHMPQAMVVPYMQVFASENKQAGVTALAAMVTGAAIVSSLCGFPVGVLADRIGRKKTMFIVIPLYWLAIVMLLFSRSSVWCIIAGTLSGFYSITETLSAAYQRELVGNKEMGTWIGLLKLVNAISSALMAFFAGWLYDRLGAIYVFILFIAIDLLVRVPVLASMPETLGSSKQ